jgi:hypothetical protein
MYTVILIEDNSILFTSNNQVEAVLFAQEQNNKAGKRICFTEYISQNGDVEEY